MNFELGCSIKTLARFFERKRGFYLLVNQKELKKAICNQQRMYSILKTKKLKIKRGNNLEKREDIDLVTKKEEYLVEKNKEYLIKKEEEYLIKKEEEGIIKLFWFLIFF